MSDVGANDSAKLLKKLMDASALRADLAELGAAMMQEYGGATGIARMSRELYEDPETTNHNKVMIYKSVQELIKACHQLAPEPDESEELEVADLKAALHGLLSDGSNGPAAS